MVNKKIYVKFGDRFECIEFNVETEKEDLKELFRSIAECDVNDILKLYNSKGNLISISNKLEQNNVNEPYRLEIIVKTINCNHDLNKIVNRIENLELQVNSLTPSSELKRVDYINEKVKNLANKLENVEHLSWLGLFKDTKFININNSITLSNNKKLRKYEQLKLIKEKFKNFCISNITDELRDYLKKPTFDNWQFEDVEMLVLVQQMFIDLELTTTFGINIETLQNYLFEVFSNYNEVPFHNFHHAFAVVQMMYGIIWITNLNKRLEPIDVLSLLIAAISHDLDHDGYNNQYQINANTALAMIYNDQSPLEMYHCAVAFSILNKENCNILASLNKDMYKRLRENIIECILATDMTHHSKILNEFKRLVNEFDYEKKEHRIVLMKILMKTADISNECRPIHVSETWLECLLTEFFNQGDHEKLNGLPLSPLMDREKVSKPSSQIGFITYVLMPLAQALSDLFPQLQNTLIEPIKDSFNHYKKMEIELNNSKTKN